MILMPAKSLDERAAISLLIGYLAGMWTKYGLRPDPVTISCLETLGAQPQHLEWLGEGIESASR